MNLKVLDPRATRVVNCGSCHACCQNDAIFMHPECGDDPAQYLTEEYEGRTILQHQENGDCIYLDRVKGCTIWSKRPTICREMDCRELVKAIGESQSHRMGLGKLVYAARRLRRNGIGSMDIGDIAFQKSGAACP